MSKSLTWNCEVMVSGSKVVTGPSTALDQQSLATVNGESWDAQWKTSCGGLKDQPCQPDAEIEPSNSNP